MSVIENKFGPDGAEAEKIIKKCSQRIWGLFEISIYTLSDLGDLSNLIGSLSRTIQPPSEWIMCELGVFPIFLENDLLKVDKILGLTFLRQEKT